MRHHTFVVPVVISALVGMIAIGSGRSAVAQEGTPTVVSGHPVIGAWLADVDTNDPENAPSLFIFHDDGTYIQADVDGSSGIGVWEATGSNTAALTALFHGEEESGEFAGTAMLRATIEVDESGDALTAEYTVDFIDPEGTSSGEMGPGMASAQRITIEPMGEPVAPLDFEDAGTPAP